jgi:hypothetical protein
MHHRTKSLLREAFGFLSLLKQPLRCFGLLRSVSI